MLTFNKYEADTFLNDYLGQPAKELQRARFYLMRQLADMFYAMAFLYIGSNAAGVARVWTGKPQASLNGIRQSELLAELK